MLIDYIIISISSLILYGLNAARGIYPGDAGDLVTAAATGGVAHPPGFPLYTALGYVLTRIPVDSPAWRMAWLSIIPHVITLLFVFSLTFRFTKSRLASYVGALVLMGNYLFFLYSATPEVFALLDFFIMILLYLAITRRLVLFSFVLGLSFSHHPLVVLMIPSFVLLLHKGKFVARSAIAFLFGLLPYLYVVWAARGSSMINWDRAVTLDRFIALVTRRDYGSFMSGGVIGHSMTERLLNVKAYIGFVLFDFTWIGIILIGVGFWWLWKKHKMVALAVGVAIVLLGPVFSFYSSFPIVNRFVLGTVERFALPSYVLLSLLVGIGVYGVYELISKKFQNGVATLFVGVLFLYPLVLGSMNVWRFFGLRDDMTANHYAVDVLSNSPQNALIFLAHDVPIFDIQYARYALNLRPDTVVLHISRLSSLDYQEQLRIAAVNVVVPKALSGEHYITTFIRANRKRPMVSNEILDVDDEDIWVPTGLVFTLVPRAMAPSADALIAMNQPLWEGFHDPASGLLSRYRHLFLTNVLDEYATFSNTYGKTLLYAGKLTEAKAQFNRSIKYDSDTQNETSWMYLGVVQSLEKDCDGAISSFQRARQPDIIPNPNIVYFEALTYRDCVGNASRAAELFSQYESVNRQTEIPLEGPLKLE